MNRRQPLALSALVQAGNLTNQLSKLLRLLALGFFVVQRRQVIRRTVQTFFTCLVTLFALLLLLFGFVAWQLF